MYYIQWHQKSPFNIYYDYRTERLIYSTCTCMYIVKILKSHFYGHGTQYIETFENFLLRDSSTEWLSMHLPHDSILFFNPSCTVNSLCFFKTTYSEFTIYIHYRADISGRLPAVCPIAVPGNAPLCAKILKSQFYGHGTQ